MDLKPCPLCGGQDIDVRAQHLSPRMSGPGALISVTIFHCCPLGERGSRVSITARGFDYKSAEEMWNKRLDTVG